MVLSSAFYPALQRRAGYVLLKTDHAASRLESLVEPVLSKGSGFRITAVPGADAKLLDY